MKLIESDSNDPFINLALDEYCARNLDTRDEYVILYVNFPSVIIGKHQNPLEETDLKFLKNNNITLARRISGGGTVFHDGGNLNFGFITKFSQNRIHNFKYFTEPVIDALKKSGIKAELNKRSNILVEGKKISGNAQFSNMKSILTHGTLLFNSDLERLSASLKPKEFPEKSKAIKSVRSKVTNLVEHLKNITFEEFIDEIKNSLNERFKLEKLLLSDAQWNEIRLLAETKYKNPDWIYSRTPDFSIQRKVKIEDEIYNLLFEISNGEVSNINFNGSIITERKRNLIIKKFLNTKFNFYGTTA